jgi:hypothetical protein
MDTRRIAITCALTLAAVACDARRHALKSTSSVDGAIGSALNDAEQASQQPDGPASQLDLSFGDRPFEIGPGLDGGLPTHSRGTTCSTASECDTGYCVDGVCCAIGACQACALSTPENPTASARRPQPAATPTTTALPKRPPTAGTMVSATATALAASAPRR